MNALFCNQTLEQLKYLPQGPFSSISYNYSSLADRILLSSIPLELQTELPIGKILREVSKLLLLNAFECALLNYMLKSANFDCAEVNNYDTAMKQLIEFDQFVYEDRKYNQVFVFVLLNGYYVKAFVNRTEQMTKIDKEIRKLIPSFTKINAEWSKKKTLKQLTLQDVNDIFAKHSYNGVQNQVNENYNAIVDQILEMSKPYNTGNKGEAEEEPRLEPRKQATKIEQNTKVKKKEFESPTHELRTRRSVLKMKRVETPQASQEDDPFEILRHNQKQFFADAPLVKDQPRNDMLNSLESFRNWNINNTYEHQNLLQSSFRRPPMMSLNQSQPSQPEAEQSPPANMTRSRRPIFRRTNSKQEL